MNRRHDLKQQNSSVQPAKGLNSFTFSHKVTSEVDASVELKSTIATTVVTDSQLRAQNSDRLMGKIFAKQIVSRRDIEKIEASS